MRARTSNFDKYWRFDHESLSCNQLVVELHKQGRKVAKSSHRSELIREANRTDRGELVYEKQNLVDLKRYILQRRLQLPQSRNSRNQLVAVLKADDDSKVFSKFLDLPPELRERIYEFYIAGFPRMLEFPSQPTLARTSKLMRKEVLPVFYKQATFRLIFNKPGNRKALNLSLPTFAWLRAQPTEFDECMRKLAFCISEPGDIIIGLSEPLIELDSSGTRFTITQAEDRGPSLSLRQGTLKQEKAYLEKALNAICGSEGKKGIGINEVYLIRKEAEASLR